MKGQAGGRVWNETPQNQSKAIVVLEEAPRVWALGVEERCVGFL